MARKKDKDAIIERPSHYCMNCIFWTSCGELEHRDYNDITWGSCSHNGYSKCPPLFTCNGWSSGKGSIIDKLEPF